MASTHLVSVEEYLRSAYEPDAEYVAGRILARSMPQKPHSKMQSFLDRTLYALLLWTCGQRWRNTWVIDPSAGGGEIHACQGTQRVEDGVFRADEIALDVRGALTFRGQQG